MEDPAFVHIIVDLYESGQLTVKKLDKLLEEDKNKILHDEVEHALIHIVDREIMRGNDPSKLYWIADWHFPGIKVRTAAVLHGSVDDLTKAMYREGGDIAKDNIIFLRVAADHASPGQLRKTATAAVQLYSWTLSDYLLEDVVSMRIAEALGDVSDLDELDFDIREYYQESSGKYLALERLRLLRTMKLEKQNRKRSMSIFERIVND